MINVIILLIGTNIWTPQQSGTTYDLNKVFFIDPYYGWAVGDDYPKGIILKTENGGNTWTTVYQTDSAPLRGVWFINRYEGWVVGGTGVPGSYIPQIILHTTDGGLTWQRVQNQNSNTNWRGAYAVQFINQKGWIGLGGWADSMGYVIHTPNNGSNWINQPLNTTAADVFSLHFIDTLTGVVCGMWNWAYPYDNSGGIVWRTVNGGDTYTVEDSWNPGPVAMGGYDDIWMCDPNTGYVAGSAGGLQVNYTGMVKKTINGGESWTPIRYSSTETYLGLHFINSQIGWVCGGGGLILFTENGGNSWSYDISNTNRFLRDIHGVGNHLWAVGTYGTILHLEYVPVQEPTLKIDYPSLSQIKETKYIDITGRKIEDKFKKGIYFELNPKGNKIFKLIKIK